MSWSQGSQVIFTIVKLIFLYTGPLIFMSVAYWQIVRVLWRSDIPGHSCKQIILPYIRYLYPWRKCSKIYPWFRSNKRFLSTKFFWTFDNFFYRYPISIQRSEPWLSSLTRFNLIVWVTLHPQYFAMMLRRKERWVRQMNNNYYAHLQCHHEHRRWTKSLRPGAEILKCNWDLDEKRQKC